MKKAKSQAPTKKHRELAGSELQHRKGTFMGIKIADPAVKPRGVSVKKIREAVAAAARKRA